jgi:hypothetical protein
LVLVIAGCGFGGSSSDGSADTSTDNEDVTTDDVTGDDNPDDSSTDAPTFDFSSCPEELYIAVEGAPSRYRFGTTNSNAYDAFNVCSGDLAEATHAVVFETQAELDALQRQVRETRAGKYWIGAIQPLQQATPGTGWIWITGGTVPAPWWRGPVEPTDYNDEDDEVDGDEHDFEQFARIDNDAATGLVDAPGGFDGFFLCECDGVPIDADAKIVLETRSD